MPCLVNYCSDDTAGKGTGVVPRIELGVFATRSVAKILVGRNQGAATGLNPAAASFWQAHLGKNILVLRHRWLGLVYGRERTAEARKKREFPRRPDCSQHRDGPGC